MSSPVTAEVRNGVLLVTLDRPKANAIDVPTSLALYRAFDRLEADSSLRVGVITGTGRFFSAGWDLHAASEGESISANHGPGGFAGLTEWFGRTKPIIAAVNGLAIGGGFELALAADLIVAADSAEFALPEVRLGMIADSGGVLRLPRRLPRAIAAELMLTGRRMDANEALRWGLVNRVAPADGLMSVTWELAEQLKAAAPLALAALLEVWRSTETLPLEEAYSRMRSGTLDAYQRMLASEDAQEGPAAFAQRRPAIWRGR
ncbi:MAG: crotonobetainyl-CoA hydratase [Rhodoferax sp.]|nr:crotonobetainyl-CoA hydratase [Rhodoferax sp.]